MQSNVGLETDATRVSEGWMQAATERQDKLCGGPILVRVHCRQRGRGVAQQSQPRASSLYNSL